MGISSTYNPAQPPLPLYAYPASIDVAANQRGMELRDYFAAIAAQGLLAGGEICGSKFELALEAYAVADALLLARQRRGQV